MVKHYTRPELILAIQDIVAGGSYECKYNGNGRAGNLIEELLGINGGNFDVADAVGFELKTSLSSNTPITLFHKDPKPRGTKTTSSAVRVLIEEFGWPSDYDGAIVASFRATMYGSWSNSSKTVTLNVTADHDKVCIMHGNVEKAFWESDILIGAAAAKLRNMMHVKAVSHDDGSISYTSAQLYESFGPLKFLRAIQEGIVAIDFDARTKPVGRGIRNHGTKFRIREKDIPMIYETVSPIAEHSATV